MTPLEKAQKKLVNLTYRLIELRNYLPGKYIGPGANVRIFNKKIRPPYSCSIVAVDHCNLSCLDCDHASPVVRRKFADSSELMPGLKNLSEVYRPRTLNLVGGEPLLHPKLVELIQAMKTVGLGKHVSLMTNAVLLNRLSDQFWDEINALELSVYPETVVNETFLEGIKLQAQKHHVKLSAYAFDKFRTTFSSRGTADSDLARRIFRTCEKAHLWGCHTISGRHLYKCAQCIYVTQIPGTRAGHDFTEDGVPLDNKKGLFGQLYDYFDSDQPLKACGYCLGTVGKIHPHTFAKPDGLAASHDRPTEDLIDYKRLEELEKGLGTFVEHRNLMFKINA